MTDTRAISIKGSSGSLGKALAILRCFVDRQERWGVKELSVALDLPVSTVHRFLRILTSEGYLVFDPDIQKYRVGMEFFRIAAVLSKRLPIGDLAKRFMSDVVERTRESCWLAVFDHASPSIVYVDEIIGPRPFHHAAPIGRREKLTESSAGLAILAHLPEADRRAELARNPSPVREAQIAETRLRGCAVERPSARASGTVLAAPVFDAHEHPVACIGVVLSEREPSNADLDAAIQVLAGAARELSDALGSRLLGGGAAGTWRLGMGVIAELVNSGGSGLGMEASWGAGDKNLIDLDSGKAGYCMAVAGSLDAAYEGRPPFSRPLERLRGMFSLFPLYLHVVARQGVSVSGLTDMAGLRISPGERGFTTASVFNRLFNLATGHTDEQPMARIVHLDYAEANRQMNEGLIDILVSLTGTPNPPYEELARSPGIDLVPIEDHVLDAFLRDEPAYRRAVILADSYSGVTRDAQTIKVPAVMCTVADRPEDEVYAITKTLYENREQLVLAAPAYRGFTSGTATTGWQTPQHPGAARFWREIKDPGD